MKFDVDRLQANTSLFGQDGAHRYWWRYDFEHQGFKGDQLERLLWVFMCPQEGPTSPQQLHQLVSAAAPMGARNMGIVCLFNSMAEVGDLMRQNDPVGPHADAALRAALDWVRNRAKYQLHAGRVILATGKPPWTFPGHVDLLEARNRYLWTQLRKRQFRASWLGEPDGSWGRNPLEPLPREVYPYRHLKLAIPNDGGPQPALEPGPVAEHWNRASSTLEQK